MNINEKDFQYDWVIIIIYKNFLDKKNELIIKFNITIIIIINKNSCSLTIKFRRNIRSINRIRKIISKKRIL